jgi:hypothetical protein
VVELFSGLKFRAYPDCQASAAGMYTHIPDSRDILFLRERMGRGISIDVGASVGLVILLLADRVQHALLFEPNPIAAQRARENLALNRLNFELHELALSDKTGTVGFEDEGGVSTCNRTVFGSPVPCPPAKSNAFNWTTFWRRMLCHIQSARSRSTFKGTKIRGWQEWRGACEMPGLVW